MKYFGWVVVEEMLQQCNQDNQTPVHIACFWNNMEAMNLLLTDDLNKIVNKIYYSTNRINIAVALRDASKRTLFWRIERLETKNLFLQNIFIISKMSCLLILFNFVMLVKFDDFLI